MTNRHTSRRSILRGIAAGAVATGIAGKTSALGSERDAGPLDRTVVGLTPDAPPGLARDAAEEVHRELDFGDIGRSVAGQFSEQAIEGLKNHPQVRYVEQDRRAYALDTNSWGVEKIGADVAHDHGYTGEGSSVAILDTGIQLDHPDLDVAGGACFGSCCSTCPEPYGDDNGHGTAVAGVVADVAPDADLYSVKVLDENGSGAFGDIANGVVWAADQGIDVLNLSLGGASGTAELEDACDYAHSRGSLVVAAAGGDGPCCDCVLYPAVYDSVVAISATDESDDLASFSATGPEIELAAPGVNIRTTDIGGGYQTLSGSSMAAPHVSGSAALVMPTGYSNTGARSQLKDTADDICRCPEDQGAGRVNVAAALGLEEPEECDQPERECQNCSDNGGCYITTATAGESDTLDSLRRFRDESMAATPVGRALVGLYYKISPPIADTLAKHPDSLSTRATRKIVETCADLSDRQEATDSRVASATLGTVLTMLYFFSIAVGATGHAGISVRERIEDA